MKSNSDSNKISENENMPAGRLLVNQSFLENIEIKSPKGKKIIKSKENVIRIKIEIKEKDVGKIFNIKEEIEGCDLKELNETNSELYINNKKYRYKTYIINEKEGIFDIKIKINILMKSCCCLFYSLDNLQSIDLSLFNTENIINMSHMFYGCNNLKSIDLSSFNAQNVTNISKMFCNCNKLKHINLSKYRAPKIPNMIDMFYECNSLESIDLSSFIASNITCVSDVFQSCCKLKNINLSYFNAPNVTNISH